MPDEFTRLLGRTVPQTEQDDPRQVANTGGGFSFAVTPEVKLERFLILGTEGGTYYITEQDLTKQNLTNLKHLTDTNPSLVVDKAVEISVAGRSYKNNAAIFALAYVLTNGTDEAKSYARQNTNAVVRTATHLFQFGKYLHLLAGGSGLGTSRNRAIAAWYEAKSTDDLAYQAVKYRQREGWTHAIAMRQSRPKGVNHALADWIFANAGSEQVSPGPQQKRISREEPPVFAQDLPLIVQGFEYAQKVNDIGGLLAVLKDYPSLPWEAIPTQFLKEPELWKKLFYNGQLNGQALVRNITRLARIKAFDDLVFARDYANKLTDAQMIAKTKLHPLNYLNAVVVHQDGQVARSADDYRTSSYSYDGRKKDWTTSAIIIDALNEGYHLAFKSVEPSNKRTLLAVDVSGSMSGSFALGLDLSAAQVSGAMAAAIARVEPYYQIMGFAHQFRDLGITANMDLNTVMKKVRDNNFGSTDCALPVRWASNNGLKFDTFVIITDNETNNPNNRHAFRELASYRQKTDINARMVVVGVAANNFSIADPTDAGMLDVVGADSNLPKLISEFSKGKI